MEKIHYCGIIPPTEKSIEKNWRLQFANISHSLTSQFGFDTKHDAQNAEKFAEYCIKNDITINAKRHI